MRRHVVAEAPHHLLVEADHVRMRLQLGDVPVVVAAAPAGVGLVVVVVRRDIPRHDEALEEVVLPILRAVVVRVVTGDQLLEHLPDFFVLVAAHLNRHRVVHGCEDAPEHEVREAQVLLRLLDQELLEPVILALRQALAQGDGAGVFRLLRLVDRHALGVRLGLLERRFIDFLSILPAEMEQISAKLWDVELEVVTEV